MARCPSCNKFVAFEELEPEVENLEIDYEGNVSAEVRIVNACTECGEELTEAHFEAEGTVELPAACKEGHEHEMEIEEGDAERTNPNHMPASSRQVLSRYRNTYYGFELTAVVTCQHCLFETEITFADDIQASGMELLT